ncbi:MAG: hypothetical protein ACSHWQ_04680 [Spongiibacteraceae bacterium]
MFAAVVKFDAVGTALGVAFSGRTMPLLFNGAGGIRLFTAAGVLPAGPWPVAALDGNPAVLGAVFVPSVC